MTARRALQASEHRMLAGGDLLAAFVAVLFAIWIWSITARFPSSVAFLADRAGWFLAAPAWMLALLPSHNVRTALSARRTAASLGQATAVLLAVCPVVDHGDGAHGFLVQGGPFVSASPAVTAGRSAGMILLSSALLTALREWAAIAVYRWRGQA